MPYKKDYVLLSVFPVKEISENSVAISKFYSDSDKPDWLKNIDLTTRRII